MSKKDVYYAPMECKYRTITCKCLNKKGKVRVCKEMNFPKNCPLEDAE